MYSFFNLVNLSFSHFQILFLKLPIIFFNKLLLYFAYVRQADEANHSVKQLPIASTPLVILLIECVKYWLLTAYYHMIFRQSIGWWFLTKAFSYI